MGSSHASTRAEPGDVDHRDVPLEVLREFMRSAAEMYSIRSIAEDARVGRSTMHSFINAGTMPHLRTRRLLALCYLRRLSGLNELELVRPYRSALATLLSDVMEPSRGVLTLTVLEAIAQACLAQGDDTPRWIQILRARAD